MSKSASPISLLNLFRCHALLACLVVTYICIAYIASHWHSVSVAEEKATGLFVKFLTDVPMMIFFVLFWRLLLLTYVERDPNRFETLRAEVATFLSDRDRIRGGLLGVALMTGVMIAFAQLKNLIPVINPFSWDFYFMQFDKALHFGEHPYQIAHAFFGWHYVVSFFTGLYNIWLFLLYFVLLGACFMRPESLLRMQFLIAFLLTWAVGGNLVATIFSSVGPVYFSHIGLGDTFANLMNMLKEHASTSSLTVVDSQALLWSLHTSEPQVNAISAFPSMHVASSVLMAIFLAQLSRPLGIFASVFAAGIMIGSVLLGWHYAVDGYAGAMIATLCWILSGWLVRITYGEKATLPLPQTQPQS